MQNALEINKQILKFKVSLNIKMLAIRNLTPKGQSKDSNPNFPQLVKKNTANDHAFSTSLCLQSKQNRISPIVA